MHARLTLEAGDAKPEVLDLTPEQPVTLGRSRDNNILLRDEHASRLHARLAFEGGVWTLQDFGLNGTRLDGERVQQSAPLEHGQEIRVGEIRLRFTLDRPTPMSPGLRSGRSTASTVRPASDASVALSSTRLELDELTTLCRFMGAAVEYSDSGDLVREALQVLLVHTGADLVCHLGLEAAEPVPRLTLPEPAAPDLTLARAICRRAQREGRAVWLGNDQNDPGRAADSLTGFAVDAVCVPLRTGRPGALLLTRARGFFAERAPRFAEVLAGFLAQAVNGLRDRRTLLAESARLREHAHESDDLVGDSPLMLRLRNLVEQEAGLATPVLLTGEPGCGKELVARLVHRRSPRADAPFVTFNTASCPPSLLEAELVGYRGGAFTGAERDHPGLLRLADEGTLFIDELADMPLECQERLAGVLARREASPLGGGPAYRCDVRVIAATTRVPEQEVRQGRLRGDLVQHFRGHSVRVPALREHAEDIPFLVRTCLDRLAVECRREVALTDAAVRKLCAYTWPGNVRQLRAALEMAVLTRDGDLLDADAFPLGANPLTGDKPPGLNLGELQTWAVRQAYRQSQGDVSRAAAVLGIAPDSVRTHLQATGLLTPMTDDTDPLPG